MLYLLMAVVSSAMVSILMRMSEKYVHGNMVMFCANYAACMVISSIYMGDILSLAFEAGTETAAILGAVTGFLYLAAFILLQKNINCNGVIFSGAAMKLGGVLIPTVAAVLLFQERMKWFRFAGAVLAAAAIVLIFCRTADRFDPCTEKEAASHSGGPAVRAADTGFIGYAEHLVAHRSSLTISRPSQNRF